MVLNFFITAEVLSWVITRCGRMERKSPARRGRSGPSAMCACAIFSTIVCPMCLSVWRPADFFEENYRTDGMKRLLRGLLDNFRCQDDFSPSENECDNAWSGKSLILPVISVYLAQI